MGGTTVAQFEWSDSWFLEAQLDVQERIAPRVLEAVSTYAEGSGDIDAPILGRGIIELQAFAR